MKLSDIKAGRFHATETDRPANAERVFHLTYNGGGVERRATFTSRVLDMSARIERDRAAAILAAPARFEDLPTAGQLRIFALATLAHALIEPPAWLDEWLGVDDELLFQLYEGVSAHERAYFLGDMDESQAQERGARVALRAIDTPPRA